MGGVQGGKVQGRGKINGVDVGDGDIIIRDVAGDGGVTGADGIIVSDSGDKGRRFWWGPLVEVKQGGLWRRAAVQRL